MKLVEPTDFEILETLDDQGRNTAQNIALILDKNRGYVNTRLPILADFGLIKRIGPAKNSGLYEITDRGREVINHRDSYPDAEGDFEALLDHD